MKIAFVIPGDAGGGVRSVVRIATGLARRGHHLKILYRKRSKNLRSITRSIYIAIRYGKKAQWLNSFPGETQPYQMLTPEIVGENDVLIGVGVSCVLEIVDLPDRCGLKINNSRDLEPWLYQHKRHAWEISMPRIVASTCIVSRMREMGSNDPIHVAHNGVDQNDYYPSVSDDHRKGIGTVYHGAEVKDPNLILSTLNNIHRIRQDVPLYVFGSFPRPKGLPEKTVYIRFPSLEQARDLYSRSVVWFMGSRSEGFGNPLLEAMACGCTIASTDCGGPADFVESGKNGFLTPVGNIDEMTLNIEKLLEDKALRETFTNNSKPVINRFTWSQAIEDFESAICSCVNDKT